MDIYQLMGAYIVGFGIVSLVYWILYIVGCWKMFAKADEPGWKAIIPIYNIYITFKISWKGYFFFIACAVGILASFMSNASSNGSTVFAVLGSILMIVEFVITVMLYNKLAKAFGKGIGFTIGLIFLTPIFIMILGFGSAQYVGADR